MHPRVWHARTKNTKRHETKTLPSRSYRPVSILPIVSKIYEKEMVRQLENYFEDILSPYISGFRKTHSCETVFIRMVEHIKKSLDHGKNVCAVLMDLSKVFHINY